MAIQPTPTTLVPAAPPPTLTPELAEVEVLRKLGHWLALAEMDDGSERSRGAAAAVRLAFAKSLGLNLPSVQELSFIHGRLNLSAQLVRALAMRSGYRVVPVERTDERCVAAILVAATGEELGRTEYTLEEARSQGLIRDRSAWKTAPRRMLWARASKRVVDDFAPEVSLGLLTPEESDEIDTIHQLPADPPSGTVESAGPQPPEGTDAAGSSQGGSGPPDPAADVPDAVVEQGQPGVEPDQEPEPPPPPDPAAHAAAQGIEYDPGAGPELPPEPSTWEEPPESEGDGEDLL